MALPKKEIPLTRVQKREDGEPALRKTEDAIEQRRQIVFELHIVRGLEIGVIAEMQGVHRNTISSDVRAIKEKLARDLREADMVEQVAVSAAQYDRIATTAMVEFEGSEDQRVREGYLGTALKARSAKDGFLSNVGYFPSRRSQIDLRVTSQLSPEAVGGVEGFVDLVQDPARRRRVVDFMQRVLRGAGGPEGVIDVQASSRSLDDEPRPVVGQPMPDLVSPPPAPPPRPVPKQMAQATFMPTIQRQGPG